EGFFGSAFSQCMSALARVRHRFFSIAAAPRLLIETTMIGGMLLLMAVVLTWGTASHELLSLFVLYGYAAFRLIPSANRVTMHINQIRHASAAVEALHRDFVAFEPGAHDAGRAPSAARPFHDVIAFEGISFTYPGAPA